MDVVMARWLVVVMVVGLWTPSAFAFHVCPTLSDTQPVTPRGISPDDTRALRALGKVRARIAEGKHLPPGQLKKLVQPELAARAPELRWFCRENPESCYSALLRPEEQAAIGSDPCDAIPVVVQGTVATAIGLGLDGRPMARLQIITDDGEALMVSAADVHRATLAKAKRVRVQAKRLAAADLLVTQDDAVETIEAVAGWNPTPYYTTGDRRALLVGVSFADSPFTQGIPGLQADARLLSDYYRETSGGLLRLTADVFPRVVQVNAPTTCGPGSDHDLVIPLIDPEVDFSTVDFFIIVSSYTACPWGGVAYLSNPFPLRTAEGQISPGVNLDREGRHGTIFHEVGHNLGAHHGAEFASANWMPLGGIYGPDVTWTEYLYPLNAMGQAGGDGPPGILHRLMYGWFVPGPQVMVSPPAGTYTLAPVGANGGLQGLVMPRAAADYWAFELRRPINRWEQTQQATKPFGCQAITTHHETFPHEAAHRVLPRTAQGCQAGDTITDPATGMDVSIVSVGPDAMVVRVNAPGVPDLRRPTVTITSHTYGGAISGNATVLATTDDPTVIRAQARLLCGSRYVWSVIDTAPPLVLSDLDTLQCPDGAAWLTVFAADATGQAQGTQIQVIVSNGGATTTTSTTTTSSSTLRPTTSSTRAPTTTTTTVRPTTSTTRAPTTSTTSTSRPPTTLPCRTAGRGERCENAACVPGTTCRTKGGQARCQ
jgi:hypothetical protein